MSQYGDFQERAEECMRFETLAKTMHDRQFFQELALAWLGRKDEAQLLKLVEPRRPDHPRSRHYH